MTLDYCVDEILGGLTGLELQYAPEADRYRAVVRALNKALRATALEREWACYASTEAVGTAVAGVREIAIRPTIRPRIMGDDSARLVDRNGVTRVWAAFLPRDAIEKYVGRQGLWVAVTRQSLRFSRPFGEHEAGLTIELPVMREPKMFQLPAQPETGGGPPVPVSDDVRNQLLDFEYPDAVIARAMFIYAQTDPMLQPRVQTLEAEYKNLFYALNEREDRSTDSPYLNDFAVPIQSTANDSSYQPLHHPHADDRY